MYVGILIVNIWWGFPPGKRFRECLSYDRIHVLHERWNLTGQYQSNERSPGYVYVNESNFHYTENKIKSTNYFLF